MHITHESLLGSLFIYLFLAPSLLLGAYLIMVRPWRPTGKNFWAAPRIVAQFWLLVLRFGVDFLTALFSRKQENR